MKRTRFTLIELLVVVGIIAVLASLVMPAISGAQMKGRITQAKSEMASLSMAIKKVQDEYGVPFRNTGTSSSPTIKVGGKTCKNVVAGLDEAGKSASKAVVQLGEEPKSASSATDDFYDAYIAELSVPTTLNFSKTDDLNINKRRVSFLEPQSGYDPTTKYTDDENREKLWRDPWGSQYRIYVKIKPSAFIKDPRSAKAFKGRALAGDVAIYSFGPNRLDDNGDNAEKGGKTTEDDIVSWE